MQEELKIIKIGYNGSVRNWTKENCLHFAKTLPTFLKREIQKRAREEGLSAVQLPLSSLQISKKLFKNYNISTVLLFKNEETYFL